MSQTNFNIRHGQFHDVDGHPQRYREIIFVPARVELTGTWFQFAFNLSETMTDLSPEARAIVPPVYDAPWVMGRLMRLFGTQQIPEEDRGEKACFYASFLAVLPERDNLAIPFECSDHYAKTALTFSTDDPPEKELQEAIAKNFWGLLLAEPTDVEDYEDRMYHSGAGIWIRFGIEDGEPFMIEESDA